MPKNITDVRRTVLEISTNELTDLITEEAIRQGWLRFSPKHTELRHSGIRDDDKWYITFQKPIGVEQIRCTE